MATIDWAKQQKYRRKNLNKVQKLGKEPFYYLLMPEMALLLSSIEDTRQRMFFGLLWHSGAKASELLSVRVSDIKFTQKNAKLLISSRKRVTSKNVFIYDTAFRKELKSFVANKRSDSNALLWDVTRQTAARWLDSILEHESLKKTEFVKSNFKITLSTFRNSFAINWLLHSAPVHMLVTIMDFKKDESAAQFVQHLSYDDSAEYKRVKYS